MTINKKRLLSTFIDLVKIDSESRNEKKVAEYIKNKLKKLKRLNTMQSNIHLKQMASL